jgi:hypothetical protein
MSASSQATDNKNWTFGPSNTHFYGAVLNDGYTGSTIWLDAQRSGMTMTKVSIEAPLVGINKSNPAYNLDINGNINFTGSLYKNGSAYTQSMPTDISCNNLRVATNMFYGANQFRYVPWTQFNYSLSTACVGTVVATTVAGASVAGTQPMANIGSSIKYAYSVIGNTMYLDYTYISNGFQTGGNSGTSGLKYLYTIPTGYSPNTTHISAHQLLSGQTATSGSIIGNCWVLKSGSWSYNGGVYLCNAGTGGSVVVNDIAIIMSINAQLTGQNNADYGESAQSVNFTFTCSFPIN